MPVSFKSVGMKYKDPTTGEYKSVVGIQGPKGDPGEKGEKGDPGIPGADISIHICTYSEYNHSTFVPNISSPNENTVYLVPHSNGSSQDLFIEWIFVNGSWERFGSATVDLDIVNQAIDDVSKIVYGKNKEGQAVPSTDPRYHNNAEYYADVAEDAAERAEYSANTSGYMNFYINDNGYLVYEHTKNMDLDFEIDELGRLVAIWP